LNLRKLRAQLVLDADNRCGYCQVPQGLINVILEMDHLKPQAVGGPLERENLWLACRTCNLYKAWRMSGRDPLTGRRVRLFNPRKQRWERHFRWSRIDIVGVTATGRATVQALQLNADVHLKPREAWFVSGLLPFEPQI
jgi:hypothetical protein